MRRLAFLSMDRLDGFVQDDDLAVAPLAERGWAVETVSWRAEADWAAYEAVVIRTPWDYQDDPDRFLAVLAGIERETVLENPLAVVRWNLRKTYLRDLEARGVPVVPTRWGEAGTAGAIPAHAAALGADEVVVKPVVSANADRTHRLRTARLGGAAGALAADFAADFAARAYMVQPFLPAVVTEGEFSLFYFDGAYSHAILKTPKARDFRVQEEHGGLIQSVEAEPALRAAGEAVMAHVDRLLYARADFVRHEGRFLLMELELIEPALYFRTDPGSAARFADAFVARSCRPRISSRSSRPASP